MASSLAHRAMVYLGLVDDDQYEEPGYDDYGDYSPPVRSGTRIAPPGSNAVSNATEPMTGGAVRALGGDDPPRVTTVSPRPAVVRPITPTQASNVVVMMPERFKDAQKIADDVKASQPVIVNLQSVDRDLSRRMIDFCSGITYALGGSMNKVADQVFLITPPNVEVTDEERQRLENGQYRA